MIERLQTTKSFSRWADAVGVLIDGNRTPEYT